MPLQTVDRQDDVAAATYASELATRALPKRPDQAAPYCDDNTIGVVPTLGIAFTGARRHG